MVNNYLFFQYIPQHSINIKYSANYNFKFSNGGSNDNESFDSLYHFLQLPEIPHGSVTVYGEIHDIFGVMDTQDVVTSVEQINNEIPNSFKLEQNYPNPFNPSTTIKYSIPRSTEYYSVNQVTLKVFNILGQEVTELVNEVKSAGNYQVQFDASSLTSGIYLYKIQVGKFSSTKKMILLN